MSTGVPVLTEVVSFTGAYCPDFSKASGSLEQHQTLVLCCLSSNGNVWDQAKYDHDHFCFAFLLAAGSAFRDLNPAGPTNSSTQGGATQLRGQSGAELGLDLCMREEAQTTVCRHGHPLIPLN